MKKVVWWFRIVGAFYSLLAVVNLYGVFVNPAVFASSMPFTGEALQAFIDGWSPFAFEVLGIGTFALWASRAPGRYLGAVWLLVWLEFTHGVLDDIYLISRGYDTVGYLIFIVVHLLIIGSGVWAVRAAERERV